MDRWRPFEPEQPATLYHVPMKRHGVPEYGKQYSTGNAAPNTPARASPLPWVQSVHTMGAEG